MNVRFYRIERVSNSPRNSPCTRAARHLFYRRELLLFSFLFYLSLYAFSLEIFIRSKPHSVRTPSLNTVGPNPLNATAMFLQLFRVNLSATSLADPPRTCWFTFNSSNGATTNDWTIPPHTPPTNTGVKLLPARLSLVWSPLCSIFILLHRSPTPYPTNKSIFCNGITIVAAGRPRKKAL